MGLFYLAYRHNGRFAGAVLAHSPMFCRLVAHMAGLEDVEHTSELARIDYDDRVPSEMTCRVLSEREVRELMRVPAPEQPSAAPR